MAEKVLAKHCPKQSIKFLCFFILEKKSEGKMRPRFFLVNPCYFVSLKERFAFALLACCFFNQLDDFVLLLVEYQFLKQILGSCSVVYCYSFSWISPPQNIYHVQLILFYTFALQKRNSLNVIPY